MTGNYQYFRINDVVEFSGDYCFQGLEETIISTFPDQFNDVLIEHPDGFVPAPVEVNYYRIDPMKKYAWVDIKTIKIKQNG